MSVVAEPLQFNRDRDVCVELGEVSSVTITADSVIITPKAKSRADTLSTYRRNALLFFLFVFLASIWFYRHFETYYSQALVVALPVIMAAWQVAFAFPKKEIDKKIEALRQKWLAQPATTAQLVGLCVVGAVFLAFTSSVWITLPAGDVKSATIEVRRADGSALMAPIELGSDSRIGGRLFFPRFVPANIELVVTKPRRYQRKSDRMQLFLPFTAVDLDFQKHFEKKPVRGLRILPGTSLRDEVRLDGSDYTLVVQGEYGPPKRIDNYRFATLYVGLENREDIRQLFAEQNTPAFGYALRQQLLNDLYSEANAAKYVARWQERTIAGTTHDFRDGEKVTVTLRAPGEPPIVVTKTMKDEMTTIMLEKP